MKLKNINFIAINIFLFFLSNADIDNILISNRISFGERNYEYVIGSIDDYKIKPFSIILLKTSACVEKYDGGTKWMHFFLKVMAY